MRSVCPTTRIGRTREKGQAMTDPTQAGQGEGGPSEEEVQQYLEQLRSAEASEIIAQAFNMLATGAQVKLGRPDARTLIDSMGGVANAASGRLPEEIATQMQEGVRQLQAAQVQAEQEAGEQPAGASADAEAAGGPGPGGGPAGQTAQPQAEEDQSKTSRLWVPGQGGGTTG